MTISQDAVVGHAMIEKQLEFLLEEIREVRKQVYEATATASREEAKAMGAVERIKKLETRQEALLEKLAEAERDISEAITSLRTMEAEKWGAKKAGAVGAGSGAAIAVVVEVLRILGVI